MVKDGVKWSKVGYFSTRQMDADSQPERFYAGEFRHSIDEKNRITIPSRWRRNRPEEFRKPSRSAALRPGCRNGRGFARTGSSTRTPGVLILLPVGLENSSEMSIVTFSPSLSISTSLGAGG